MASPPLAPETLAQDPRFVAWVTQPDPSTDAYWRQWLVDHPDQRTAVAQARTLVLFLHERQPDESATTEREWHRLRQELGDSEQQPATPVVPLTRRRRGYAAAAAVALLVGWWAAVRPFATQLYQTRVGETRRLELPDGSHVTLNASSQLRTRTDGWGRFSREVWLEGGAFFEVRKTTDQRRFVVRTDQTAIEVLGTRFDVRARRRATRVVLEEGRVQLRPAARPVLRLSPGDWVQFSDSTLTRRRVRAATYRSWTDNRFVFEAVPLAEVLQSLEDRYGYRIRLADPDLGKRTYTGILPIPADGRVLLRAVAETYGLTLRGTESDFDLQ
jgi:ferric-dicitrate binding protein FerR (iron transport regulator)